MLPPASAVASAAVLLLAVAGLGAAEPLRARRSPPFEPFSEDGNYYMGDEFARAASPPAGLPPSAFNWIKAALAHAEALTKQAQQLAEALQHKLVPGWPGRRAGDGDEEAEEKARQEAKAKEEAAKVAAMQAKIHEQQQQMQARIHAAQEEMQKKLQSLSHLLPFSRAAALPWEPLQQARAAALPARQQLQELIRIQDGAPLHTVHLPGFPSHMFQPGGGDALPGFLEGFQQT